MIVAYILNEIWKNCFFRAIGKIYKILGDIVESTGDSRKLFILTNDSERSLQIYEGNLFYLIKVYYLCKPNEDDFMQSYLFSDPPKDVFAAKTPYIDDILGSIFSMIA